MPSTPDLADALLISPSPTVQYIALYTAIDVNTAGVATFDRAHVDSSDTATVYNTAHGAYMPTPTIATKTPDLLISSAANVGFVTEFFNTTNAPATAAETTPRCPGIYAIANKTNGNYLTLPTRLT